MLKKFIPLRYKIILAFLPLIAIFVAFSYLTVQGNQYRYAKKTDEKRASTLATSLAIVGSQALESKNTAQAKDNVVRIGHLPDVAYAMVINQNGTVKAHSDSSELGKKYSDEDTKHALSEASECVQYLKWRGEKILDVSVPIRVKDNQVGVARVGLILDDSAMLYKQSSRHILGLTLFLFSGCLLFVVFMTYCYGNPLLLLTKVSQELAQGKLDARAIEGRSDEIGLIGHSLNSMSANLQAVLEREQSSLYTLQGRIRSLRDFANKVMSGDLETQASIDDIDEVGQLGMTMNELVRHLRSLIAENRQLAEEIKNPDLKKNTENSLEDTITSHPENKESDDIPSRFELDTIIAMSPPVPTAKAQVPELPMVQDMPSSGLAKAGELNESQQEYVHRLNQLGSGKTALIATGGSEDSYPFLKELLEDEGFSVLHASTIAELIDMATIIMPHVIIIEFNNMTNGNQHAANKLRTTKQCANTSLIILEAVLSTSLQYNSMHDIIQIIIPDSDQELSVMIREALAEILLTGGTNPFITPGRCRELPDPAPVRPTRRKH